MKPSDLANLNRRRFIALTGCGLTSACSSVGNVSSGFTEYGKIYPTVALCIGYTYAPDFENFDRFAAAIEAGISPNTMANAADRIHQTLREVDNRRGDVSLRAVLHTNYQDGKPRILPADRRESDELLDTIRTDVAPHITPDTNVFVYYGGHGFAYDCRFSIITPDYSPYPIQTVFDALFAKRPRSLVAVLDACQVYEDRAEAYLRSQAGEGSDEFGGECGRDIVINSQNTALIYSTSDFQSAETDAGTGFAETPFTLALSKSLQERGDVLDLFSRINRNLDVQAERSGIVPESRPVFKSNLSLPVELSGSATPLRVFYPN